MRNWFNKKSDPPSSSIQGAAVEELATVAELQGLVGLVSEMRRGAEELGQQVRAAEIDEKRLTELVDQSVKRMELCQKEAEMAVVDGQDENAKQALMFRNAADERRQRYLQILADHQKILSELRTSWAVLQTKTREYEGRLMDMQHKQRTVEAYRRASLLKATISRAQEAIDVAVARADAHETIDEDFTRARGRTSR